MTMHPIRCSVKADRITPLSMRAALDCFCQKFPSKGD